VAKNMYEVFDEFELASSKKDKMKVIENNLSNTLIDVLKMTFHPDIQWLITEMPYEYKVPDTLPGISYANLSTELRKLYLFRKGNITAESMTPRKRTELLLQLIESLEFREAEVIIGIISKDLGVKGLTYKFVKEAFPAMLP
jgi:hypothetical protein